MSLRLSEDRHWTYEDYRSLPDDGNRYEVLDGKLYMTPAPSPYHQTLSRRVQFVFYELERQGKGQIFNAPVDVLMPGASPVQPDLVFLRPDQAHLVTEQAITGVPELIVEILSPSTAGYDRTTKLNKYAAAGVPHYWLLERSTKTLLLLKLDGATYRLVASLGPGDRHEPPDFPGVVLDLDALFEGLPEKD